MQTTVEIPRTEEQLRSVWGMGFEPNEPIEQEEIQVVIKISKEAYDNARWRTNRGLATYSDMKIAKGTPLPKEHGRLKDADEILTSERPKGITDDVWKESHIYKLLSNAPTIIEADKA